MDCRMDVRTGRSWELRPLRKPFARTSLISHIEGNPKNFMKYIVGVDNSENSRRAFHLTLKLCRPPTDEIIILHCIEKVEGMSLSSSRRLIQQLTIPSTIASIGLSLLRMKRRQKLSSSNMSKTSKDQGYDISYSMFDSWDHETAYRIMVLSGQDPQRKLVEAVDNMEGEKIFVLGMRGLNWAQR